MSCFFLVSLKVCSIPSAVSLHIGFLRSSILPIKDSNWFSHSFRHNPGSNYTVLTNLALFFIAEVTDQNFVDEDLDKEVASQTEIKAAVLASTSSDQVILVVC